MYACIYETYIIHTHTHVRNYCSSGYQNYNKAALRLEYFVFWLSKFVCTVRNLPKILMHFFSNILFVLICQRVYNNAFIAHVLLY